MKASQTCPKCQSGDITHFETVADRGNYNLPEPMTLGFKKDVSGWFAKWASEGQLEAFTCKQCGYTEFYVRNVSEIEKPGDSS